MLKKSYSVQKIIDLKRKIIFDADLHKLCEKIEKLTESMSEVVAERKKLQSNLVIKQNFNHRLKERIVYLEEKQVKGEHYISRSNIKISSIPKSIPDNDPESTTVSICKDSGVEVEVKDIEGCHWLPLSINSIRQDKNVIVKVINWKHSEALWADKK